MSRRTTPQSSKRMTVAEARERLERLVPYLRGGGGGVTVSGGEPTRQCAFVEGLFRAAHESLKCSYMPRFRLLSQPSRSRFRSLLLHHFLHAEAEGIRRGERVPSQHGLLAPSQKDGKVPEAPAGGGRDGETIKHNRLNRAITF